MSHRVKKLVFAAAVSVAAISAANAQTFGVAGPQAAQSAPSASAVELAPKVTLEVAAIRRLGQQGVTQLDFTVTNRSDLPITLRDLGLASNFAIEGVKLVDFANKRRYAMGLSEGVCLCTTFGGVDGGLVKPGETKSYWAWFALPATDVREMSVIIPDRAPILNVTLR